MKQYLSVKELQRRLGISRAFAYKLIKEPGFPVINLGKRKLISETDLENWLLSQEFGMHKNAGHNSNTVYLNK